MTYAVCRNAAGSKFIVSNAVKRSDGTSFTVADTVKRSDGTSFNIFTATVTVEPISVPVKFIAVPNRKFVA
jgi:hypothetical protein